MGSYEGHALPGAFFIFFALFWAVRLGASWRKTSQRTSREAREASTLYLQSTVRLVRGKAFPLLAVVQSIFLVIGAFEEFVVYGQSNWNNMNNVMHAAMYLMFVLPAIAEILHYFSFNLSAMNGLLPSFVVPLSYGVAFMGVALLFNSHLHGRVDLDVHLHVLVFNVSFVIALVFAAEALFPRQQALAFMRSLLILLLGMWFVKVGDILYRNPWPVDEHGIMQATTLFVMFSLIASLVTVAAVATGFVLAPFVTLIDPPRWYASHDEELAMSTDTEMAFLKD